MPPRPPELMKLPPPMLAPATPGPAENPAPPPPPPPKSSTGGVAELGGEPQKALYPKPELPPRPYPSPI